MSHAPPRRSSSSAATTLTRSRESPFVPWTRQLPGAAPQDAVALELGEQRVTVTVTALARRQLRDRDGAVMDADGASAAHVGEPAVEVVGELRDLHRLHEVTIARQRRRERRAQRALAAATRGADRRGMVNLLRFTFLSSLLLVSGCSFHSTATHWNGRTDADGKPVFVQTTTNVGLNALIVLPILGSTTIDAMLDTTSAAIAERDSNRVRVIQTSSENYWYGFPPFTWILTPVITDVAVEYEPSAKEIAAAVAADPRLARRMREDEERRRLRREHAAPAATETTVAAGPAAR
jgi:hypothetical protein